MRFVSYVLSPTGYYSSISGLVEGVDVAIDFVLHHLRWLELNVRGKTDLDHAHLTSSTIHAIVVEVPDDGYCPTYIPRADLGKHAVVRRLCFHKIDSPRRWLWDVQDEGG